MEVHVVKICKAMPSEAILPINPPVWPPADHVVAAVLVWACLRGLDSRILRVHL